MALSIGAAVYIAIKPLIKIFLNGGMGFLLAKQSMIRSIASGVSD